ncbi:class I adenylate-forming enzyme family protein [Sphingomonas cavernae]|uniref:AMP-dependent synthetase n=1 Tax=Sphingomonas cavernae TaxID=2320861 RepID=A0A418WS33_9SPHN|nr:class I adenylate-forming enzyme family protein [Sphingomonas cavernae]RJF94041.1 AMP-dependent synthetase [Sphingomonas cavernae]
MPSALDRRIDEAIAKVTGSGGPLPVTMIERYGVELPMIAAAPPALSYYFAHFCAQHGDATFLVSGDERLSFAQTYAAAKQVAAALIDGYGLKRGDRVSIAMRNAPAWIVTYMGVLMAGGVATLLNGWWQGNELVDGIRDTGTQLVIADAARVQRLAEHPEHGAAVVGLDVGLPIGQAIAPIVARGGSDQTALPQLTGDDLATILFTSGSTGQSKGAYSDHRGVVQGIFSYLANTLAMLDLATQDGNAPTVQPCTLLNVPLFHVTAEIPVMLQSFAMGRKLVLMPKWDAEEAMRLMEREKATYFVGVPLMSYEIMTHPNRHKYDLSTVAHFAAGGAPRPPEHVKRLNDEMGGGKPILGYGLTETNAVGCGNLNENYLAKPNSTGPASKPLVDLAILDDAGRPVPQGERGEVSIRTICNFLGYWNNEEATRAAMTSDGYFRTGDIGYLDADGYLFIVDRKKDIIIRGGENISCVEVEAAIYEHPAVAESAVFGLADDRFGEVPGAVVHLHKGETLEIAQLLEFLGERLAAFKLPCRVWFVAEPLPRLGTEKIDKVSLRAKYRALAQFEAVE